MNDLMNSVLESADLGSIASSLGISTDDAKAGLSGLLPSLTGAAQGKARQEGGMGSLIEMISGGGLQDLIEAPQNASAPHVVENGNGLLGELFGSKETSREVAKETAAKTGVDSSILKKLLPIAASLVMAYLAKRAKGAPDASAGASDGGGGIGDILGGLLDKDGDGSIIDDIGGSLGGLLGR